MKLHAIPITIAIAIAGIAGTAAAGDRRVLPPVVVSASDLSGCAPPTAAAACENFHYWIRANFSEREIGMLFGARTSYPEYLTGGVERLHERFQTLVQEYVAARAATSEHIAAR